MWPVLVCILEALGVVFVGNIFVVLPWFVRCVGGCRSVVGTCLARILPALKALIIDPSALASEACMAAVCSRACAVHVPCMCRACVVHVPCMRCVYTVPHSVLSAV